MEVAQIMLGAATVFISKMQEVEKSHKSAVR